MAYSFSEENLYKIIIKSKLVSYVRFVTEWDGFQNPDENNEMIFDRVSLTAGLFPLSEYPARVGLELNGYLKEKENLRLARLDDLIDKEVVYILESLKRVNLPPLEVNEMEWRRFSDRFERQNKQNLVVFVHPLWERIIK